MRDARQKRREHLLSTNTALLVGSCAFVFLSFFALVFLYFHFIGPRKYVGGWITHEPLSTTASLAVAFAMTLFLAIVMAVKSK